MRAVLESAVHSKAAQQLCTQQITAEEMLLAQFSSYDSSRLLAVKRFRVIANNRAASSKQQQHNVTSASHVTNTAVTELL
jgi:hypothetical protein